MLGTLSESVLMLMEGFFTLTAVLEPHLRLRPAAAPQSCSPSVLPVPGDDLLPSLSKKRDFINGLAAPKGTGDVALTAKRNPAG